MKENKNIKILELFSGIGGFSKGFTKFEKENPEIV